MDETTERQGFIKYFQNNSLPIYKYEYILWRVHLFALKYGLSESDMLLITQVTLNKSIDSKNLNLVLKCLVPRLYVNNDVLEIILQFTVHQFMAKGSVDIINQLLHWLIGVLEYKLVVTKNYINLYYEIFRRMFLYDTIAVSAAKLVYLLTSPEDVNRPYTDCLIKLHNKYILKKESCFGVLIRLFKCYKPQIVTEAVVFYSVTTAFGSIQNTFKHSFEITALRIKSFYRIYRGFNAILWCKKFRQHIVQKRPEFQLVPKFPRNNIKNKDVFALIISNVQINILYQYTSNRTDSPKSILSFINNAKDRYILAYSDEVVQIRLCLELAIILKHAFVFKKSSVPAIIRENLLIKIVNLQNQLRQAIPTVTEFIELYMLWWDGVEHEQIIYDLIEWVYILSYSTLHKNVLFKLKLLFINKNLRSKCMILKCVGNLIANLISFHARERFGLSPLFLKIKENFDFNEVFEKLLKFLKNMSVCGILLEDGHPAIMNKITNVYAKIFEMAERANMKLNNIEIAAFILYWPLFHSNPTSLTEMCLLVNRYPKCIPPIVKEDYVNCLWHNKAFFKNNKKSVFHILTPNKVLYIYQTFGLPEYVYNWQNHIALICYNSLIKKDNNLSEIEMKNQCVRVALNNYFDVCCFMGLF